MKLSLYFNLLALLTPFSFTLTADNSGVQAEQVWQAINEKKPNMKKAKALYDAMAGDAEIYNLAMIETNFLDRLAALPLTQESLQMLKDFLNATKNFEMDEWRQRQIKNAITRLSGCKNTEIDYKSDIVQKALISVIRHADTFDICEYSEAHFIDVVLRYGNTEDLIKVLKSITSDWYTGEMVSRLQEHFKSVIKDRSGVPHNFVDVVLAYEAQRLKQLKSKGTPFAAATGFTLYDEVKNRIKNPIYSKIPIYNDDKVILKKILKKIEAKKNGK